MFKLSSEQELTRCFRDSDQDQIILTEEIQNQLKESRLIIDYMRWIEPSGARAYLVFKGENFKAPLGIVFRRDQSLGPQSAAMCEWCHTVGSGNEIGMLTTTSQHRKRIGVSLCRDLRCADRIRSSEFNSSASVQERIRRLVLKMTIFAQRELI